jgi:hypothetical protein
LRISINSAKNDLQVYPFNPIIHAMNPPIPPTFSEAKAKLEAEFAADLAALKRVYERGLLNNLSNAQLNGLQVSGTPSPSSALSAILQQGGFPSASIRPIRTSGRRTSSMTTELAVLGIAEKLSDLYTVADIIQQLEEQGRPTPRTSVREALEELVDRGIVTVVRVGKAGRATVYRTASQSVTASNDAELQDVLGDLP